MGYFREIPYFTEIFKNSHLWVAKENIHATAKWIIFDAKLSV
jgi:hypothetical protein